MTEVKAVWWGRVEEAFNALRHAPYDAQERACQSVTDRDGVEAGAKLRELFEAEHAKVRRLADKAKAVTAKLPEPIKAQRKLGAEREASASLKNPKTQPRVEESKVTPKAEPNKPAEPDREWRNGGREYRLKGETIWRRHFGEGPRAVPQLKVVEQRKPEEEPEPEEEATKPEPEAAVKVGLPAVAPSVAPAGWDDAMTAMNRQHAIIENVGGKAVIASWEPSTVDPSKLVVVFQNKESFLLRYSNRTVPVEHHTARGVTIAKVPLGQWWLGHRDRQQFRGVTFKPNGPRVAGGCLNLWQGWGVEARPGDWGLVREHIRVVIAGGNKEFGDYIENWIAWSIQNPASQAEVALVLIGLKGVGKGTLVRCLQRIFGAHAFQVTSREEVIGKFNGHLQDCVLFVADEAYWGGDKRCVGRLQGMITEPTLPIERKGIDLIQVPNYLHVVMLAEPGWVIPAGRYERRYAAFDVPAVRRRDRDYFRALHKQIAEGGAEAMFHDLVRMELGGWHPRDIPDVLLINPALQRQQEFTLPPLEQWYLMLLHDGVLPGAVVNRPNKAWTRSLLDDAKERVPRLKWDLTEVALRDFLVGLDIPCTKYRAARSNGWSLAPLDELRAAWIRRWGPVEWDNPETEWG